MTIEMDYCSQEPTDNGLLILNIQDVINEETDFLGYFIMTVNEKFYTYLFLISKG